MKKRILHQLSRRERQIMDALYQLGEGSVSDVQRALADPPSYSSVRTLLGVLENKGFVRHKKAGRAYVYLPTISRDKARDSALKHMVQTFFDGSVEHVVAALITQSGGKLSDEDFERLEKLIRQKRKEEGE
jgi:predicted transcriptional regulator